jgi:2,4-dienoyl-CoA reductase-like NADH-dependent reductase (Old Yellow Enzyme family)/thioredoxin reductase
VELRNRLVFQPHFTALGGLDGMPSDAHVAYHEERARGGVGLIVFESQAVNPSGKMSRRFVNAWDRAVIPMYRKVTDAVHQHGAKIFSQLTHGGHTSLEHPPHLMWAPTQMPEPSSNFSTKAMDQADIEATIRGFAEAASNAREGGFDGIEVKVAHDGLLRSFVSPFFNRRTDSYGGSFENRLRMPVEVFQAIRQATEEDFVIGVRICLDEYTNFGFGLDYGLQVSQYLEQAGVVDYFNCDAGSFSSYWMEIPPFAVPEGNFRHLNAALKKVTQLPVIAFGRVKRPELAESILAAGEADLIGMARQLIADPETPNKVREGRASEIRFCIGDNACIYQVGQEKAVRCIHNPAAGRERGLSERVLPPVSRPRRIVVVGGGPAGLKVAETAARRGHQVTLFERGPVLGGQLMLAARQPLHQEIREVVEYLEAVVRRLGVDLRTVTEVTSPAQLRGAKPDVIVVATGSEPNLPGRASDSGVLARSLGRQILPDVLGLDGPNVLSVDEVLAGAPLPGPRALVADRNGHWEAAGTAEFLADAGCEVQVITGGGALGADLEGTNFELLQQRVAKKGIRVSPHTVLREVAPGRVRVKHVLTDSEDWIEGSDFIVMAVGRRSREDLFLRLIDTFPDVELQRVGDCVAPRLLISVVAEAYMLGREL